MNDIKSTNIKWHDAIVRKTDLESLHGHRGVTLWFTGLSGAGKSTVANAVACRLHQMKVSTFILDGDNIRHGLNRNLGFSKADRTENIRRVGEVARLFSQAGIVTLSASISPYRADREQVRALQPDSFVEVYCKADVSVCEKRDPKGLYKQARAGDITGFTGIDAPYEVPDNPEIIIDTGTKPLEWCVDAVVTYLVAQRIIFPDSSGG